MVLNGTNEDRGADIARKLERLLETFTHPDGSSWCGSEIERATNKVVSQAYFSALRKGRIGRPSAEQLKAIAEVMDFPLELWHAEFDQWPRILQMRMPGRSTSGGSDLRSIRQNFHAIRQTVPNPKTKEPYTYEEISERAGDALSTEEVRRIADGEDENPYYATIMALSEVFNVSTDFWHANSANRGSVLDTEVLDALSSDHGQAVLRGWFRLSAGYQGVVLNMLENLEELETKYPDPSSG